MFGMKEYVVAFYINSTKKLYRWDYKCTNLRSDDVVIHIVSQIGLEKAQGPNCKLKLREVQSGTIYSIDDVDGKESIEIIGNVNTTHNVAY